MKTSSSRVYACICAVLMVFMGAAGAMASDTYTPQELARMAQDGWHQTYAAHGREIVVDIPIQVPEVERFPSLTASLMPAAKGFPIAANTEYEPDNSATYFNDQGFFRIDMPGLAYKRSLARSSTNQMPNGYAAKETAILFNHIDMDSAYAYANDTTIRQSLELLMDTWQKYFPDETIELMPYNVYVYGASYMYDYSSNTYSGDPWPLSQGTQLADFSQVMRGIPVLGYAANSFYQHTYDARLNERYTNIGATAVSAGMLDIGLDQMSYDLHYSLLKEQSILDESLQLCSLSKVIQTFEALIEAGKLRTVESLRLGYIAWGNAKDATTFTLLPTWVLEGELYQSADASSANRIPNPDVPSPEYGQVLVNAQTGELIDPWNYSTTRFFDLP